MKALGERDDVLLLNALKLVASIAAHPGNEKDAGGPAATPTYKTRTAKIRHRLFCSGRSRGRMLCVYFISQGLDYCYYG